MTYCRCQCWPPHILYVNYTPIFVLYLIILIRRLKTSMIGWLFGKEQWNRWFNGPKVTSATTLPIFTLMLFSLILKFKYHVLRFFLLRLGLHLLPWSIICCHLPALPPLIPRKCSVAHFVLDLITPIRLAIKLANISTIGPGSGGWVSPSCSCRFVFYYNSITISCALFYHC